MEIDALDDFDTRFQPTFNAEFTSWNGHGVKWLSDLGMRLHERLTENSSLTHRVISAFHSITGTKTVIRPDKMKKNIWAGTQNLVNFYLGQKRTPGETLVRAAEYVISGRISLRDLLAPDYLDRLIQIVPFALPDYVNLPFFELPEGLSFETIISCPVLLQIFLPYCRPPNSHFNPFFAAGQLDQYLVWLSWQYAESTATTLTTAVTPTLALAKSAETSAMQAQTAAIAATQTSDPNTAIEQFQIVLTSAEDARIAAATAEENRIAAEATAQIKAEIATRERAKALAAELAKVRAESAPPPFELKSGRLYFSHELKAYEKWLDDKRSTAEIAAQQNLIAAAAEEDARIFSSIAAGHTEASKTAKEHAETASLTALQTQNVVATTCISAPSLIMPPTFYPQLNLEDLFRKEYTSQLSQQFQLPELACEQVLSGSSFTPPLSTVLPNAQVLSALETIGKGVTASVNLFSEGTDQGKTLVLNGLETIGRGMIDPDILNFEIDPLGPWNISFAEKSASKESFIHSLEGKLTIAKADASDIAAVSCYLHSQGLVNPHFGIGTINGMGNGKELVIKNRDYLNSFVPGLSIDCVWNKSHGLPADLAEILLLNYAGSSPHTADLLVKTWTEFHLNNLDNPDAKYLQFCHSQGTIHTYNAAEAAPQEIRDRLIIVGIAPAAVVKKGMCFRSYYYASKSDFVYLGELFRADIECAGKNDYETAMMKLEIMQKLKDSIIFLDPHPVAKGIDHDFLSPTFYERIQRHIAEHVKCNGVYK